MNNQNRRALRRVELTEQENDVGDEDRLPNVIWARADSGNWIDYDPPALKWTKYYRSDYVDDMLEDAMQDAYKDGLKKGRRAARGDEPDVAAERIAQLEADLAAADEEARKLREIICDAWRKDADADPSMFDLTNGETAATEPEQLSDEDAQILELVRLMREGACANITFWQQAHTKKLLVRFADGPPWQTLDEAITELRSRLQPKPQRPTAESMIAELRNIKTTDDLWDWWQDTLEDWDAAGGESNGESIRE